MNRRNEWLRAMAFSVVVHIGLLAGIGWFAGHIFMAQITEPIVVEVDLIADPGLEEGATASQTAAVSKAAPAPQPELVMPATVPVNQQVIPAFAETESVLTETAVASQTSSNLIDSSSVQGTNGTGESSGSGSGSNSGSGAGSGGGTGKGTRGLLSPPRILQKVEPQYPESARRDGVEGSVTVKMEIMENGKPGSVWVVGSSGRSELDEAAVKAVERWRFVPARDSSNGQPVACITTVAVVFRLN